MQQADQAVARRRIGDGLGAGVCAGPALLVEHEAPHPAQEAPGVAPVLRRAPSGQRKRKPQNRGRAGPYRGRRGIRRRVPGCVGKSRGGGARRAESPRGNRPLEGVRANDSRRVRRPGHAPIPNRGLALGGACLSWVLVANDRRRPLGRGAATEPWGIPPRFPRAPSRSASRDGWTAFPPSIARFYFRCAFILSCRAGSLEVWHISMHLLHISLPL